MTNFVTNIYNFIYSLFDSVLNVINSNDYVSFLDKQIVGGTLLNIGITWRELLLYFTTWLTITLFIILIIKLIFKIFGLFRVN